MKHLNEDFFDLDDLTTYAFDPGGVYSWLERSDQNLETARKAYFENPDVSPGMGDDIREIIITGMGGSAISGDIASSLVSGELKIPCRIVRGYNLPGSLGKNTLLIVISYSGETEESIWAYSQGHNRGASIVSITTGGTLAEMASRHGHSVVKLDCDYPAPRLALTHILPALLFTLSYLVPGLDNMNEALRDAVTTLKRGLNRYEKNLPFDRNFAKRLAYDIHNSWPVIVASDTMYPAAMRFAAQLNENSKWPAHASVIPEMNHNEVVAYGQPGPATNMTGILFIRDKEDHPRVQFRQDFTQDLIGKNVAWVHQLKGEGKTLLGRMMSILQTADFTSYYLAVARGLDPLTIKPIDTLKERLGKIK